MIDVEEFDKTFKGIGGHFDYNKLVKPELFENFLKSCRNEISIIQQRHPSFAHVYVDVINCNSLGAVVTKTNEMYYIGIYKGTFFLLNDLFFRMLSSNEILRTYGDVSKEGKTKKIFNAQIIDTDLLFLLRDPSDSVAPKDSDRFILAQLLASFAMKFLFMHEVGHVLFGHLDYLTKEDKLNIISEVPPSSERNKLDPVLSQTLEMDADCYAVKMGLQQLLVCYDNIDKVKKELQPFYSSLEQSIFLWLFSIYSLFRLFGFNNHDIKRIRNTSHPQTGIRQHFVFATTHTIFQTKSIPGLLDKLPIIFKDVVIDVENAFKEISEQNLDLRAIAVGYHKDSQDHALFLLKNWNNVRSLLEKHAIGNLAPLFEG